MKATVLDTKTGKTAISEGIRSWDWAEGNWSCDCNRQYLFGIEDNGGVCLGGKRYIVIKADFDMPEDYEYSLLELNSYYPAELLKEHGIT